MTDSDTFGFKRRWLSLDSRLRLFLIPHPLPKCKALSGTYIPMAKAKTIKAKVTYRIRSVEQGPVVDSLFSPSQPAASSSSR